MSLRKKMLNGVVWSAVDRLSMQVVQFVIGIVLARLLTPKEYGTIGLILVFTALSRVFIESGFPTALVQKKNRSKEDISTVFVFNIGLSLFCYVTLFLIAPFIAQFYGIPLLNILLRVLALSLIINAFYIIPATLFTIALDFKAVAKINFIATLLAGILAILLAYYGYGVWALVWQTVFRSVLTLSIAYYQTQWKMSFTFSKESFKSMLKYGSNLLVSSLLNRIVSDLTALFIGKVYNTNDLGLYSRGAQFSELLSSSYITVLTRVLLPSLAQFQDHPKVLKEKFQQILNLTNLLCFPIFFGLFILSEPLIKVLLTDKWIEVVPVMQVFCFARLITIWCLLNINVLLILGRTDLALKQQYWAIGIRVVFLMAALKFGIFYVALAELTATCIHLFINSYYPGKLIYYHLSTQMKETAIYFLLSVIMIFSIYCSLLSIESSELKLLVGFVVGAVVYIFLIFTFRKRDILLLKNIIKK